MPTYDYVCDACGHKYELFQSMTAKPVKKCPSCGKAKARRLIGAGAGLIFKGAGFYITDYRDKSYGDAAKSDTTAAAPATPAASTAAGGGEAPKTAPQSSPVTGEKAAAAAPAASPAPAAPKASRSAPKCSSRSK
jgi:putative FmdB family regulatory protein